MDDSPHSLIPLPFSIDVSHSRISRGISQNLTKIRINLIYNSTVPLSFKTFPEDIFTLYLLFVNVTHIFFLDTHFVVETPDEHSFSIYFTSSLNSNETLRKNIHPTNVFIPIANVFTTILKTARKHNLLLEHAFTPSAIQALFKKKLLLTFPIMNNFALSK